MIHRHLALFLCLVAAAISIVICTDDAKATPADCVVTATCASYSLYDLTCIPPLPAGAAQCQVTGGWTLVCQVVLSTCNFTMSSYCPTCGKNQTAGGHPINLSNGNTYIQQTDIKVPGLGGGLTLERTWDSIWPTLSSGFRTGIFGLGWRSTYEERVFLNSNFMVYLKSDGGYWIFTSSGGSTWNLASPASIVATLTLNTGTPQTWTLQFQNGEQRIFDYTSGSLTAIVDPNGNTTQLTYDASSKLTTVTDPASRHLYFTYNTSNPPLVTSVTSDAAASWGYSYDSNGRLIQVTKPDSTVVSFTYDSNSLISQVLDNSGKVLESHTYDSQGRGLTSARAGGVESVSITYP